MRWLSGAVLFPLLLSSLACGSRHNSKLNSTESIDEDFVRETLTLSPTAATAQGLHESHGTVLDENLDDFSPSGIKHSRDVYLKFLERVEQAAKTELNEEERADLELIRLGCQLALLDLRAIQSYRHNPTLYVEMIGNGLYSPFILNYATESKRLAQITGRIEQIPAVLETAKKNLESAPSISTEVAEAENQGNIDLIEQTIRPRIPPDLKGRFDPAAKNARGALESFNAFLKDDLAKRQADWRLGTQLYDEKFKLSLATGNTPSQTLSDAEAELARVREEMRRQARAIYPRYFPQRQPPLNLNALVSSVLDKVAAQHTSPDRYFDDARNDLAATTDFVRRKHLLTLPQGNNLQVIPTPEFMRGIYGVGGFSLAPALEPRLNSYYWITPLTADMSSDRIESKLREYNRYGLEILTIHEAMPGHYLQAEYANQVQPKWRGVLRSLYGNTPYVEGWAVYATELLINQGFDETPEMRLTFGKQMLRVISNTILDIRMHTANMTDQQALDLMIGETFQEKEEAEKKLQRAKLSSCQLPAYFVGWHGWDQLRSREQQNQKTAFHLSHFHERALREGAVTLPSLERLLAR